MNFGRDEAPLCPTPEARVSVTRTLCCAAAASGVAAATPPRPRATAPATTPITARRTGAGTGRTVLLHEIVTRTDTSGLSPAPRAGRPFEYAHRAASRRTQLWVRHGGLETR